MPVANTEQALNQYIEALRARGVATKSLTLARHFLRYLLSALKDQPQNGNGYRRAADETLRNFPDQPQLVEFVRQFFPYWSGEVDLESGPDSIGLNSNQNLSEAFMKMESDPWSSATITSLERQLHLLRSLARYEEQLRQAGINEENAKARARLIKLLIYSIRDSAQNTDTYRAGVDEMLKLFKDTEKWHVFVGLAREFFYFLAHDSDAPSKLQKNIDLEDIRALMAG
ncbi:hypothetical protein [Parachitinimonas caeni]|uniref:Uncharacterized protein n=1 Tax=Parachitinimonas caeni TaxID=3031301 RepID=A0ABT7DZM9_9NEIS|nr:hypothetical protein [Parachitinimonas caeni]MDK2125525.1 hypothetical protein [Parachitinimonas caeni]